MSQIHSFDVHEFFDRRGQKFRDTELYNAIHLSGVYPSEDVWIAGGAVRKAIMGNPLDRAT
jgi:uncharacterized membrane protein